MIEAREFRLGNYYLGFDNKAHQVDLRFFELLADGIECDEIIKSCIPFTEEWRLKAGLERDGWLPLKDDQLIEWSGGGVMISGPDAVINGHCFFAKCEYVHQFQNLIYALTGTELTFDK